METHVIPPSDVIKLQLQIYNMNLFRGSLQHLFPILVCM